MSDLEQLRAAMEPFCSDFGRWPTVIIHSVITPRTHVQQGVKQSVHLSSVVSMKIASHLSSIEYIHVSAPGVVDRFGNNLRRLRALPNNSEHNVASFRWFRLICCVCKSLRCLDLKMCPSASVVTLVLLGLYYCVYRSLVAVRLHMQ
jgi:hypothetical protein